MKRILLFFLQLQSLCMQAQTGLLYDSSLLTSTQIIGICQDETGYVWIATEFGLNRYDGYRFTHYLHNDADSTSLIHNFMTSMLCDSEGNLWVGTIKGLQRYDAATGSFASYHFPDGLEPRVSSLLECVDGRLLVGTSGYGIFAVKKGTRQLELQRQLMADDSDKYFNHLYQSADGALWNSGAGRLECTPQGGRPEPVTLALGLPTDFFDLDGMTIGVCADGLAAYRHGLPADCPVSTSGMPPYCNFKNAAKGANGDIYIGTNGNGLFYLPKGSRQLQRLTATVLGINLQKTKIGHIMADREGNLWIGCQHKGLVMIPNRTTQFATWSFSAQKQDIGTYVSSVCQGDGDLLWCTVEDQGVYAFNSDGLIVAHPQAPQDVRCIYRDRQGGYWLGTRHGLYAYDPLSGRARLLSGFDCQAFNCMADDGRGHVVVSAFAKGLLVYDRATSQFKHISMYSQRDVSKGVLHNNWIQALMTDGDGRVWVATSAGVTCYDAATDRLNPFGWEVACEGLFCTSLCETLRGDVLIGTLQGLYVWNRQTNTTQMLSGSEPLANLVVSYIAQDSSGDLWCSTSEGIWHYSAAERLWASYVSGPGLDAREYVSSVGLHSAADRICFATADGLVTFFPQQMRQQTATGDLQLTGFYIDNRAVSTLTQSNGTQVTALPVSQSSHFTVSYLDSSVALEFSLLNYADAANTIFEHRLGSDGPWVASGIGHNIVELNHLASGTYTLEVRAVCGELTSPTKTITIAVLAPWYRTTLAYIIYILAAIVLISALVLMWLRHVRLNIEDEKMKFLINATHDIRSPLTLIMGGIDKLGAIVTDPAATEAVDVVDRNAQRILKLVNQILDVRKIDKQQMRLNCQQTDLGSFLKDVCKPYDFTAKERGIAFTIHVGDGVPPVWIDRTQFDKVVSNLLSNAFKYSYDMGEIDINLTSGHDDRAHGALKNYVQMSITDTGTGMREGTLQHLFDRFYQGTTDKSAHVEGTGIGLNLCKMIVSMHRGTISGANRQDGIKGSVFTVRLPQGNSHLSEGEINYHKDDLTTIPLKSGQKAATSIRILIVDDDEEIPRYISQELGHYYHFTMCRNGKDGLRELLTNDYNLVVSDVMMPEMDGFTMLRMIRTNGQVNDMPVIMLTSKTDVGNRIEGLERGADAYLTKPFSIRELHATIDNLIATRQRLHGKYSGRLITTGQIKDIEVKGNDERFMERIIDCINSHIGDSNFNVSMLCREVGISRAHLHRKMKAMTGITITDFMRNIRLEQAARLLVEDKVNITQVAYSVGYASLPYFSAVFKKHFGMSPTEYIEKNKT